MANKLSDSFDKDRDGVKYKYPERTCKDCSRYPCFRGIERSVCDFAKYGCVHYKDGGVNKRQNELVGSEDDSIYHTR